MENEKMSGAAARTGGFNKEKEMRILWKEQENNWVKYNRNNISKSTNKIEFYTWKTKETEKI